MNIVDTNNIDDRYKELGDISNEHAILNQRSNTVKEEINKILVNNIFKSKALQESEWAVSDRVMWLYGSINKFRQLYKILELTFPNNISLGDNVHVQNNGATIQIVCNNQNEMLKFIKNNNLKIDFQNIFNLRDTLKKDIEKIDDLLEHYKDFINVTSKIQV